MNHLSSRGMSFCTRVAVGLASLAGVGSAAGLAQDSPLADARRTEKKAAPQPEQPHGTWRAFGRVTDQNGRPLVGVEVSAHCGNGTLRRTGVATSGADGRYVLTFGEGVLFVRGDGRSLQAATITAHKPGYFEKNLNRQGDCVGASGPPSEQEIKVWGNRKDRVFVPDRPLELNFVMCPAGRVAGKLVDERSQPLVGYSVALDGPDLPPSSSVLCAANTDLQGRFSLEDIPTTYRFQFEVRKAHPQPPWNDSWASAALRFERPDREDLRAWFGKREIRVQELVIRVVGPGVHGRTATPIAGNAGVLDLTTGDLAGVLERSATRLVAKSAVLTLRNAPRQDLSHSLISESVPVAPARGSD